MGDAFSCTILQYAWIPLTLLSILIAALIISKYNKEEDYLKKERLAAKIKYPVLLFMASLILIFLLDNIVKNDYLNMGCKGTYVSGQASCGVISEFADGTNRRMITFPPGGGFDSGTKIKIPKDATITKTEIIFMHPQTGVWNANFSTRDSIGESSGIDIDSRGGYAYMKMKKVEVSSPVTWEGTVTLDELRIKRGGAITAPLGKALDLRISGTLTIDVGGAINLDGKGDKNTDIVDPQKEGDLYASGGGGAGHGGRGGKGGDEPPMIGGAGDPPYGLAEDPTEPGSAGGNGGGARGARGSGDPGTGALGGGVLIIQADEIAVNGDVSANGLNAPGSLSSEGTAGGGGGSGGSIRISANNIIISGKVSASGGNGGSDPGNDAAGGGGGGGRILITAEIINGDTIYADGGKSGAARQGLTGRSGEKGTVQLSKKQRAIESLLIKSYITSVEIKPDDMRCWQIFSARYEAPAGSDISFSIINASNNKTLCDVKPADAAAGYDISRCASCEKGIRLRTDMVTISVAKSPKLYNWGLRYETGIKELKIDAGLDRTVEYTNSSFYSNTTVSDDNTQPRISGELTRLAKECTCRGCSPEGDGCTITLDFSSGSTGALILENPDIEYCAPA